MTSEQDYPKNVKDLWLFGRLGRTIDSFLRDLDKDLDPDPNPGIFLLPSPISIL